MTTPSNRPTSPHLQAYQLPLTGIISISHRITGVLLSAGLLIIVYMILAIAGGEASYASMQNIMGSWLIRPLYWGFIYALFFHLCHGVRHLFWDAGHTFDPETLHKYAQIELIASVALTFIALVL